MSNSELPKGWRECKLGDVAEICSSKRIFAKEYVELGIPFYRSKEIIEKELGIEIKNPLYISATRFKEIKDIYGSPKDGDILLSAVGERSGIPYLVANDGDFYFKDGNLIWLKNFNIATTSDFLYYWFKSEIGQNYLMNSMIGSAQRALTIQGIRGLEINLPPLAEQKAIAEVLSSLDDKIDLLHQQNQTLEDMAQTLFREWFIEKADEGWEEVKLGDLIEPKKGKNITKKQAKGGDYPVVAGGLEPSCYHNDFNTKSPVVTISASGANAGYVRLYLSEVWSSDSSFIDSTITDYVYFFYIFLKINQQTLFDNQTGSAQPHIYPAQIMDLDLLNPPKDLMLKFENIAKDIFSKIEINQKQIKSLEQTRDTLLPKLMSGQVRV
ncbi:restriction endonuclease subunit S [Francisella hispaniensis]|uniref:restriction endonuclease subunit S n=1 Tax=Francisella hispaniensis TaxID=622488 RepID=UPI001908BE43|nr:restriction endonuclease subunit S [Francisella hispaniensis]MBK2356179.1 restriction endonuclease subunit S [Francisella hispaniensis]